MITAIAKGIDEDETAKILPWLAGLQAANCALLFVAHVEIATDGVYIKAQVGSFAEKLGTLDIDTSTIQAAVPVAAAVYFIPWRKLAQWLLTQWETFLSFLKNVWKCIKDRFDDFMGFVLMIIKYWRGGSDSPPPTCIPLLPIH